MNIFHFGGDEVPHGAWLGSPACHEYLGYDNLTSDDADELMTEFVVRVGEMVHTKGLNFAGWEDGLMLGITEPFDREEFQHDKVYGYTWNNIWEWGGGSRAYVLANNDFNVSVKYLSAAEINAFKVWLSGGKIIWRFLT